MRAVHQRRQRGLLFSLTVLGLACAGQAAAMAADPDDFEEEIEERGPVRVYVTQVEELIDSSENSPYVLLLRELLDGFPKDISLQIMPYRRAVRSFVHDQQSCLYIANDDFNYAPYGNPDLTQVRYSQPVNRLRIKFYVREGRTPPETLEALRGLTVASEPGVYSIASTEPEVAGRARLMSVESLQAALALLAKGRVDAVASYGLDFAQYEALHGDQGVVTHPDFGVGDIFERIACWKGGSRTRLLDHIDDEIGRAVRDGRWRRILGKGAEYPQLAD